MIHLCLEAGSGGKTGSLFVLVPQNKFASMVETFKKH